MGYNVIPMQTTYLVDTAFNCITAIYGPYNGAKVSGYSGLVNKSAIPSYLPDGSDLPYSDISTLRFFFNLGQRVYLYIMKNYFIYLILYIAALSSGAVLSVLGARTDLLGYCN
jgi:hypothetical protein